MCNYSVTLFLLKVVVIGKKKMNSKRKRLKIYIYNKEQIRISELYQVQLTTAESLYRFPTDLLDDTHNTSVYE